MRRPLARRAVALVIVSATGLLATQVLGAQAVETRSVNVVIADLDAAGNAAVVTLNEFTRSYSDSGNTDNADATRLTLTDGLVEIDGDKRALPVIVKTHYFLDDQEISAKDIAGKAGAFRVTWEVTNRTQKAQEVTYTDSVTGKEKTVVAATMVPFTVSLSDLVLPDGSFDELTSNGVVGRTPKNDASSFNWTAVLAPPVFPGTANFTIEGLTSAFKLPPSDIVAVPGVSGAMPKSVSDAAENGGAEVATLRGYISKFGSGFASLGDGLGQMKGGLDQIFSGINSTLKPGLKNPTFDPTLYAEDSTLAYNQPGLIQALELLGAGLDSMIDGAALVRGGLKSGDATKPGVYEGLTQVIGGIGQGNEFDGQGNPLTVRASLNALKVGLSSGDANAPGIVEGLQKINAAIGNGTEFSGSTPLTIRASINAVRAGLKSGDVNNPAIIEGLNTIYAAIGNGTEFNGTTPLTVAAGLAAVRGGLSSGDMNDPAIIEGLQTIYGSIGNGSEFSGDVPLTLAASLVAVRAALSSGDPNNPAILEGLQTIYAGIGVGNEFSGQTPLTVRASLNAIRGALSTGSQVNPGVIEGVQQVVAGMAQMKTELDGFSSTFLDTVNQQLNLLTLPSLDLLTAPVVQGVLDAGIAQAKAGLDQMSAGLSSGDPQNPKVLEGLQQIFASIGTGAGNEFNGATPLTIQASLVAMRAGLSSGDPLNPKIIEGIQQVFAAVGAGNEFNGTTPLTIRAGLNAIRAGLQSGDVNNPAILEGLQQIFDSIGTGSEFVNGLPKTLQASLKAIRAGLSSGDVNNPAIIEGLNTIYASLGLGNEFNGTTPLTIQAALVALQQGVAQLEGGAQLAHDAIGEGTEFAPDGSPLTLQAALAAIGAGATQLAGGINQIVAGLGDVDASGTPVKAVTTRVSKYGNTLESPATLLYGLEASKQVVLTKFVLGVTQIVDALGDPNVTSATILSGLKQISDGLGLAGAGATEGGGGAETLGHIIGAGVSSADSATALHQAGLERAAQYAGFGDEGGTAHRTVIVLRQGGVA
ncbi:MAG: hypothetical protein Q8K63_02995 [Acidimicrobiales bacterium]|nr:hypothetical protein [Acidimicrobiales bacterium]